MKFNDEIIEIEDLGYEEEMIDIGVNSDDHLFYGNDLLIKNSYGIPATADWMGAIIQPQELYEQGKYLLKNIKTRFDETLYQVETVGVDRSHMRLYDVEESEKDLPITVRERLEYQDKLRQEAQIKEDDKVFLFDEDFE